MTYRLAGTLPRIVHEQLERERERLHQLPRDLKYSEQEWQIRLEKRLFALWDERLDSDTRIQFLAEPRIASIVRENLYYHAGTKYSLWAYVIMPNHVHVLLKPEETWERRFERENGRAAYEKGPLSAILHSLRSYTAKEANKVLGRTGKFWQREAYDHWVRDSAEFERVIFYIENNPVKAGLVEQPQDWHFSSAYDRVQRGLGTFDRIA